MPGAIDAMLEGSLDAAAVNRRRGEIAKSARKVVERPHMRYSTVSNAFWETYLNVSTRGVGVDGEGSDAHRYSTISYASIFRVLSFLQLNQLDTLVDVGCGKGRVLCCAATLRLNRVIGVEIDGVLAAAARLNVHSMRGRRTDVEIVEGAAENVDYTAATALYLFNPFGEDTLRKVIARMASRRREKAPLRVAYVNPTCGDTFRDFGYEVYAQWKAGRELIEHDVWFLRG